MRRDLVDELDLVLVELVLVELEQRHPSAPSFV
jgi:hypothetical protein